MIITYNIVYCVRDEEFDSFCCRFTTMSPVMELGGCRIASPAWQTNSLGTRWHVGKTRRRRLITCCRFLPTARRFWPGHLISPTRRGCTALWNAIFTSLIASEIHVIDTLRFNNDVDYLYRLATVLEMRLNHEYWCEPECTWQTNSMNKTTTSERLDSWASRLWRGIELVFKSLDCFTVQPNFFQPDRLLEWSVFHFIYSFFFLGGGGLLSSNAFTIWCCIPIIRPPRVIRRFKRRSCYRINEMLIAINDMQAENNKNNDVVIINNRRIPVITITWYHANKSDRKVRNVCPFSCLLPKLTFNYPIRCYFPL